MASWQSGAETGDEQTVTEPPPQGTALDVPKTNGPNRVGGGGPGGGLILVRETSVHLHLHGLGESVVALLRVGGTRPVLGVVAVVRGL